MSGEIECLTLRSTGQYKPKTCAFLSENPPRPSGGVDPFSHTIHTLRRTRILTVRGNDSKIQPNTVRVRFSRSVRSLSQEALHVFSMEDSHHN